MAYTELAAELGLPVWTFVIFLIWTLIWKGLALWKSARLKNVVWFVILLVVNTGGILEILYIFVFSKMGLKKKSKTTIKIPSLEKKKPKKKK